MRFYEKRWCPGLDKYPLLVFRNLCMYTRFRVEYVYGLVGRSGVPKEKSERASTNIQRLDGLHVFTATIGRFVDTIFEHMWIVAIELDSLILILFKQDPFSREVFRDVRTWQGETLLEIYRETLQTIQWTAKTGVITWITVLIRHIFSGA